jgi:hypothetical protein
MVRYNNEHNDTQHNDTEHNETKLMTFSITVNKT